MIALLTYSSMEFGVFWKIVAFVLEFDYLFHWSQRNFQIIRIAIFSYSCSASGLAQPFGHCLIGPSFIYNRHFTIVLDRIPLRFLNFILLLFMMTRAHFILQITSYIIHFELQLAVVFSHITLFLF